MSHCHINNSNHAQRHNKNEQAGTSLRAAFHPLFRRSSLFAPTNDENFTELSCQGASLQRTAMNLALRVDFSAATLSLFPQDMAFMTLFVCNSWRSSFRSPCLFPLRRKWDLPETLAIHDLKI
jgi:hypothetical protein